jgi:hypothetical protein
MPLRSPFPCFPSLSIYSLIQSPFALPRLEWSCVAQGLFFPFLLVLFVGGGTCFGAAGEVSRRGCASALASEVGLMRAGLCVPLCLRICRPFLF